MELASLSDEWYIVLPAYILAFLLWVAFSGTSFTNDKWKSVRLTRRAGYINLAFSIVPACYIMLYCTIQFSALDNREGSAALIVLYFALLHAFRSAWGLWQLHLFRTWCSESIEALEAIGVRYSFCDENRRQIVEDQCRSAWETCDEMLVNDGIVNNQILYGETVCRIQYGNNVHLQAPEVPYYFQWFDVVRLVASYVVFWLKGLFCTIIMLWDGVRFSIGLETCGKLRQVPIQPVNVYVNWAIVFAAQGLRTWLAEFKVSLNRNRHGERRTGTKDWEELKSHFASEILASVFSPCVMQLCPELEGGRHRNNKMRPMLWIGWKKGSVMHSGRLLKKELLKNAVSSGEVLPFGVAHKAFLRHRKDSDAEIGYTEFSRQLSSKIRSLDVKREFCSEIQNLDVEMLEWLTILLYMGRRSLKMREGRLENREEVSKGDEGSGTGGSVNDIADSDDEIVDDSLGQATRNLAQQPSRPLGSEASSE
ncbi:hypothetical protein BWQ96_00910 [Gracilariopsis chorda]|uniref:Uncharacterized protein n=1 Tax=Gracilariopsis chorda TaxID=448386 RepID=A0A2V3J4F5_9FLOR|nr:hypothetical protein BWQ96_00910 [Gracilariopsis chorda]|eukprot:PXF49336.1 hypothetical protein BWQ96_00910 [Gracilariopsis chorda]